MAMTMKHQFVKSNEYNRHPVEKRDPEKVGKTAWIRSLRGNDRKDDAESCVIKSPAYP